MKPRTKGSEVAAGLRRINPTILSARAMLPWEKAEDYQAIVTALGEEHEPEGPIEEYLVDELAWVFWRKRRLAMAETSAFRRGLTEALGKYGGTVSAALTIDRESGGYEGWVERAIHTPDGETADEIEWDEDAETMAQRALKLLDSNRADAYEAALATLREDVKSGWDWEIANDPKKEADERVGYKPDSKGLRTFLEGHVLPWCRGNLKEHQGRALVREQAYGEALGALRALDDHEAYLDRKLETTLETLAERQDRRGSSDW
jgi:hypothetical protein